MDEQPIKTDKRKVSSSKNLKKARQVKLDKLANKREEKKDISF